MCDVLLKKNRHYFKRSRRDGEYAAQARGMKRVGGKNEKKTEDIIKINNNVEARE